MKIEVTDLSPVRKQMVVEVEPSVVDAETAAVLRRFATQVRIPGFRPGKAPKNVIEKKFQSAIVEELDDRLVRQAQRVVDDSLSQ